MLIAVAGEVRLDECMLSAPPPGHIQVRTRVSGLSPGTEQLMIDRSRELGGEPVRLGYQLCGDVIDVGPGIGDQFAPGDLVACYGGPYTHHASQANVPRHLAVKLPPTGVDPRHAAFCGLGGVALHAFRRAGLSLGETVAVIGLGMLGNLTAQVARAAGCRLVALDTIASRRTQAAACGIPVVESMADVEVRVREFSSGHGADAVLIVVNNCTSDLLREAVLLCRERGRVVVVGTAQAALPRDEVFSREVDITVSRAAGPGRYDSSYEAGCHDYPYAYARWTEGRNLGEYVRLIAEQRIALQPLMTSEFAPGEAAHAYEVLRSSPQDHTGVVFNWQI